ncbi:hypothetical protein C0993_003490 [Termitomyces sp. T159_Od127]|nr:hypothetical protein C0993_003490 [Termitomyces sp. T159_Od127]
MEPQYPATVVSALGSYIPHALTLKNVTLGVGAVIGYFVVHRLWIWPLFLSPLRSIPGPPLGHPIFGQSLVIVRSESGIPQREWVKEYGPVVRIVGPVGIERLIFMKPDALHHILVKHWLEYPRPSFLRHILGLVTGYGLLTVTGNEHRQMRRAINPAFSLPNLMARLSKSYTPPSKARKIQRKAKSFLCTNGVRTMLYNFKGICIIEPPAVSKVTLDIICQTAFGYKADSLHDPHNELAEAYEELLGLQSGVREGILPTLLIDH